MGNWTYPDFFAILLFEAANWSQAILCVEKSQLIKERNQTRTVLEDGGGA